MKEISKFTNEQAKELLEAAKEFNNAKPWKWLGDTDVFGIKFYDIDEIIFCSVLGMGDEVYGMATYKGLQGIESYFKILEGMFDYDDEALYIQNAITIYFDDRKDISDEDYALIKSSGVTFRGRKAWPSFRKFEPGFLPWYLKDEELVLFTRMLNIASEFAVYLKDNLDKAALMQEGKCFVRDIKEDGSYEDVIIEYNKLQEESNIDIEVPIIYNELEVKRIKKNCKRIDVIWEIDYFYHFMPVQEEDAPFFPAIMFIVDKNEGTIIGENMTHPHDVAESFQQYLLNMIKEFKNIPVKVQVSNIYLLMYIEDLFNNLGVKVELVERLEIMPVIKGEFFNAINEQQF